MLRAVPSFVGIIIGGIVGGALVEWCFQALGLCSGRDSGTSNGAVTSLLSEYGTNQPCIVYAAVA